MDPLRFKPIFKQTIWGGDKIAAFKNMDVQMDNVGESWELSGVEGALSVVDDGTPLAGLNIEELIERYGDELLGRGMTEKFGGHFPLLIKLIDAHSDLSLQVHPDDVLAERLHGCKGKTESWYVADCEEDARIYCGLSHSFTPEEYDRRVKAKSIMEIVKSHRSEKGAFFYVPAGTLHAIGAGNVIAEIQQTSDVTYRVYDHDRKDANGNPRQLHTAEAREAIDYSYPAIAHPNGERFADTRIDAVISPFFRIDYLKLSGEPHETNHEAESFRILIVTEGEGTLEANGSEYALRRGQTWLLPASLCHFRLLGIITALLVRL